MTDTVTPGFKQLQAKGLTFVKPMRTTQEFQTISGTWSRVRSVAESCGATHAHNEEDISGPYGFSGVFAPGNWTLPPIALLTDSEIKSAIDVAATRAWSKSSGHLAEILTDIAEMRQTIQLLTKPWSSMLPLIRAITSARKGGGGGIKGIGKGAGASARDVWLQYRYGVRPLVSSVTGIMKALDKPIAIKRETYRASNTISKMGTVNGTFASWSTSCGYSDVRQDIVDVRAGILMQEALDLPSTLGVDGAGLLSTPWELIPFSFVADWFINVGDFLGAMVPYLSKNPIGTWYTVKRTQTRVWKITSTTAVNPSSYTIVRPANEIRAMTLITKYRVPGLPAPSLTLKPQAIRSIINDLRIIDAMALACQQLGRALKG
jgi:hypothetical protein